MVNSGVSRVAVEVIILVIGVALALFTFSPLGSYVLHVLNRVGVVGMETQVEITSVEVQTDNMLLYVRNMGPSDVELSGNASKDWQVFVDNNATSVQSAYEGTDPGDAFEVDEYVVIRANALAGSVWSPLRPYVIIIYGPGVTRTEYLYTP